MCMMRSVLPIYPKINFCAIFSQKKKKKKEKKVMSNGVLQAMKELETKWKRYTGEEFSMMNEFRLPAKNSKKCACYYAFASTIALAAYYKKKRKIIRDSFPRVMNWDLTRRGQVWTRCCWHQTLCFLNLYVNWSFDIVRVFSELLTNTNI
uniref:Uncharacterized protein n=1 Tax=Onchocerca volvulus TaxID=6282 RepID=A0A8R1U043_ONCVO